MVVPLVVYGVIAAASAISQWMNSQDAKKANAAERARMKDLIDKLQDPQFDSSYITPEDYQVVAKYVPQVAEKFAEVNPTLIQNTANMQEGRAAQMNALRKLSGIADESSDPALMQQLNEAERGSQQQAQSRYESQMQDAQRKGMYGSGISQALAQGAGADAMAQGAQASQAAAAQAYKNRLAALSEGAQLGGQINTQDVAFQGRNADIINSFNDRTATANQQWANNAANTINEGNRYNVGVQQDVANRNTAATNQAAINHQQTYNQNQANMGNWEMSKIGLNSNMSTQNQAANNQNAQDTNQAIGGLANAGMSGYMYNQDQDLQQQRLAEQKRLNDARIASYKTQPAA